MSAPYFASFVKPGFAFDTSMLRMSLTVEANPKTTGVPGRTVWAKTFRPRNFAQASDTLPASEMGPVAPAMFPGAMTRGWPFFAQTSMVSSVFSAK